MNRRPDTKADRDAWHPEAMRLRKDLGMKYAEIAAIVNRDESTVSSYLRRNGLGNGKSNGKGGNRTHAVLQVEPREARSPRQVLAPAAVKSNAIKEFAAGKITRDEMMRRITVNA